MEKKVTISLTEGDVMVALLSYVNEQGSDHFENLGKINVLNGDSATRLLFTGLELEVS